MKQVICINAGRYALTVGNQYTADETARDNYLRLTNDRNRLVDYHVSLFNDASPQDDVDDVSPQVCRNETPTPEPQERSTVNEILESCNITYEDDVLSCMYVVDGRNKTFNRELINNGRLGISCGIRSISGLNNLASHIAQHVPDRDDLQIKIFRKLVLHLVDNSGTTGMVLFSTNTDNNAHSQLITQSMDLISDSVLTTYNPNSENTIALWAFIQEQHDNDDDTITCEHA